MVDGSQHQLKSNRANFLNQVCLNKGYTSQFQAVNVLTQHGVKEERIILSNLFCTPAAVQAVVDYVPKMKILTAELHPVAPNHFGMKYFGTDWYKHEEA